MNEFYQVASINSNQIDWQKLKEQMTVGFWGWASLFIGRLWLWRCHSPKQKIKKQNIRRRNVNRIGGTD